MSPLWKPPLSEASRGRAYILAAYDDRDAFTRLRSELESNFGAIEYESEPFPAEMRISSYGFPRRFAHIISFMRPVAREELVDMRRRTLGLESRRQKEGRPLVEFDPGYVVEFSVVRSSLVEDFHRIYIYGGIFAETLYYFDKFSFCPYNHTETFFRRKSIISAFNDIRLIHLAQ